MTKRTFNGNHLKDSLEFIYFLCSVNKRENSHLKVSIQVMEDILCVTEEMESNNVVRCN